LKDFSVHLFYLNHIPGRHAECYWTDVLQKQQEEEEGAGSGEAKKEGQQPETQEEPRVHRCPQHSMEPPYEFD
jgi:hypothetical protein